MSEQKLRRKTFLATLGAVALGAVGLRGSEPRRRTVEPSPVARSDSRVVKEPRAVPCSGSKL